MWNVMNKEMRMPALAAAACAAVILVASPVSAATIEEGRTAATAYRQAIAADCAEYSGKAKSGCMNKIGQARQAASQKQRECEAEGNTREFCLGKVADYWIELAY